MVSTEKTPAVVSGKAERALRIDERSCAGHVESVAFWRAARDVGLPFANPRLFPWTLANSPTGAIAMALGITGPTYTLVGLRDAVLGCAECALDDLSAGVVRSALLIGLDQVAGTFALHTELLRSPTAAAGLLARVSRVSYDARPADVLATSAVWSPEAGLAGDRLEVGEHNRPVSILGDPVHRG